MTHRKTLTNQLSATLICPDCARDYSGDTGDDDIYIDAPCPEPDCCGYDGLTESEAARVIAKGRTP